jgi:hypothetical protein
MPRSKTTEKMMSRARQRRRAVAFARYMNRVTKLGAHSVSWQAVWAMNVQEGNPWYFVRRYNEDFTRGGRRG